MGSSDIFPSLHVFLEPKLLKKNIDTVRNPLEKNVNLFHFPSRASERCRKIPDSSLDKEQIVTAVNATRAQACIDSDGGAFKYKRKYFLRGIVFIIEGRGLKFGSLM